MDSPKQRIRVAIAVLHRDGRILVRRRRAGEHLPGLWEFPGGKVLEDESPIEAAEREVREEMSVEAIGLTPVEIIEHDYAERSVHISVFEGSCSGEPSPPDGAEWAWTTPTDLAGLPMPAANRTLVTRLARTLRKDDQ